MINKNKLLYSSRNPMILSGMNIHFIEKFNTWLFLFFFYQYICFIKIQKLPLQTLFWQTLEIHSLLLVQIFPGKILFNLLTFWQVAGLLKLALQKGHIESVWLAQGLSQIHFSDSSLTWAHASLVNKFIRIYWDS